MASKLIFFFLPIYFLLSLPAYYIDGSTINLQIKRYGGFQDSPTIALLVIRLPSQELVQIRRMILLIRAPK